MFCVRARVLLYLPRGILSYSSMSKFARVSYHAKLSQITSSETERYEIFMVLVGVRHRWPRNALKLAHAKLACASKRLRPPISLM